MKSTFLALGLYIFGVSALLTYGAGCGKGEYRSTAGECCPMCSIGTKDSDTVCEPCPPGFYSPEGVNCTKWTDFSVRNEVEVQEGTSIRDVQCRAPRKRYGLIPAFVLYLPTVLVLFLKRKMNCSTGLKVSADILYKNLTASIIIRPLCVLQKRSADSSNSQPVSSKNLTVFWVTTYPACSSLMCCN
ncbi:tumor necrosis factor receptor superfamily member 5-like isoform X4 [Neoarius graeffei]|uniref:tumor necrosis factor receptor superfamily member 5-like isoform X4 n=1 Tax=Neoarius graeffei TaxID=443677 RepID=UPI00298D3578|nr:tumor necrosis factor receptor superfamily member 5-like isoform X4 [Neoarius graeffei]